MSWAFCSVLGKIQYFQEVGIFGFLILFNFYLLCFLLMFGLFLVGFFYEWEV